MAAVTSAVLGLASSAYQIGSSIKANKDAKNAIRDFKSQDLTNPYDQLTVDTTKADQQTEANLSNFATATQALRESGSRGVFSGIPRLTEANQILQEAISADLAKQARENKILFAQGEQRIQGIRENREQLALQGLGQQLQTSRQDLASGVFNLASSTLAFGSALDYNNANKYRPKDLQTVGSVPTAGFSSLDRYGQIQVPNLQPLILN